MISKQVLYVDFHCHCDLLPDFDNNSFQLDEEVAAIAVTTTPLAWRKNVEVSKRITTMYPALGMHPQLIASRLSDFKEFSKHLEVASIVGEIGLDGSSSFKDSLKTQEEVLSQILSMCAQMKTNRILSIHSLRAEIKLIKHLQEYVSKSNMTPVMHWFTGSITQASKLLDMGAKFSINHKMIGTKKGQQLLAHIPVDAVLIETDLPFTSKSYDSTLHRKLLANTTMQISARWDICREECSDIILRNSKEILLDCYSLNS
jgi:TatD DNase family protein